MDNQNPNQSLFSLRINENSKMQLGAAAAVAGITAILSLVSSILKLISAFTTKNKIGYVSNEGFTQTRTSLERGSNIGGAIFGLIISILLFYFLNRFSSHTKSGLNGNNQELVNSGLGGLSGYMITVGIIVIICLVLVLIVLAGASAGGAI